MLRSLCVVDSLISSGIGLRFGSFREICGCGFAVKHRGRNVVFLTWGLCFLGVMLEDVPS